MVLQLVQRGRGEQSDEGWNTMTDALVDDAVELALDEVMKDKTYAMLLKTKLGAATAGGGPRPRSKSSWSTTPTFMNQRPCRRCQTMLPTRPQKGVSRRLVRPRRCMDRLQARPAARCRRTWWLE